MLNSEIRDHDEMRRAFQVQYDTERDARERLKQQIIADKTELIQKEAIISEYDYRVQEQ